MLRVNADDAEDHKGTRPSGSHEYNHDDRGCRKLHRAAESSPIGCSPVNGLCVMSMREAAIVSSLIASVAIGAFLFVVFTDATTHGRTNVESHLPSTGTTSSLLLSSYATGYVAVPTR